MIVIDLWYTHVTEARHVAMPTGPRHALTLLNSSGGAYCASCPEEAHIVQGFRQIAEQLAPNSTRAEIVTFSLSKSTGFCAMAGSARRLRKACKEQAARTTRRTMSAIAQLPARTTCVGSLARPTFGSDDARPHRAAWEGLYLAPDPSFSKSAAQVSGQDPADPGP